MDAAEKGEYTLRSTGSFKSHHSSAPSPSYSGNGGEPSYEEITEIHQTLGRRMWDSFKRNPDLTVTPKGVVGANGRVFGRLILIQICWTLRGAESLGIVSVVYIPASEMNFKLLSSPHNQPFTLLIRWTDPHVAAAATVNSPLARKLKGRHLQMIAFGGSIGRIDSRKFILRLVSDAF